MRITIPQLLLAAIACASFVNGLAKYARKERNQTLFKLVASVLVWGTVATFALFPEWARAISVRAGLGENLNTLIFIGFTVVFVILFKLLSLIERLESHVSEIVRREALERMATEQRARRDR